MHISVTHMFKGKIVREVGLTGNFTNWPHHYFVLYYATLKLQLIPSCKSAQTPPLSPSLPPDIRCKYYSVCTAHAFIREMSAYPTKACPFPLKYLD